MHLLLLPGMDGTGRLFEPLVRSLPPALSARVVSYPPDQALGYDELLPIVESAAAECSDFVAVGESFSGPLALKLAAKSPRGLRGVVLCASFVRFPLPALPEKWRALVRPWMFRHPPIGLLRWALLGTCRSSALGNILRDAVMSVSAEAMAARAISVAGVDVTAELRTCPVPVLYLRATKDWVIPRACWELVRSVRPDTELTELDGPHLVLQTLPGESARALASFCDNVCQFEI